MNVPSARREVARRLVGEALARVREVPRELLRRQLAVPAGAEHGLVEEDAAARRTRRSAAGSSSPRTAPGRLLLRGRTTAWRKPSSPLRSASVPAVTATRDCERREERSAPKAPARELRIPASVATARYRPRRLAREAPSEIAEAARDDRHGCERPRPAAAARCIARQTDRESHRRQRRRGRARRGTTPWRLPAPPTNPTAPQQHGDDGVRDDQLRERAQPCAAVEEGGGSECERAELERLAGRGEGGCCRSESK